MVLLLGISTSTFSQDFYIADSFRDALVKDGVDTDGDGYISMAEAHVVTSIDVENKKLSDLKGISEFINLKSLKCSYNYLSSLDVSENIHLEQLQCFQNRLTSLKISNNSNLRGVYCFENYLTSIDVSGLPNLGNFQCYKNRITSLDLTANTILIRLDCTYNQLTELDLSSNSKLDYLSCGGNQISFLDVSYLTELTTLACSHNNLSTLDLTRCRKLNELYTEENPALKSICVWNISEAENKIYFYKDSWVDWVTDCALSFKGTIFKNKLVNLNLDTNGDGYIRKSEVADVKTLNLANGPFDKKYVEKLDNIKGIEGFVNLTVLSMSYNNVESMDISRNTKLTSLTCDNNKLTGLDISNNTSITYLKCTNNNISTIYVWDIDYAEGNSSFRKDAAAKWAIHGTLSNSNNKFLQCSIYPIPSNRYFFIDTETAAELTIYNLLGEEVISSFSIDKGRNYITLDLNPDIYLLKLQSKNKSVVKRIIIK